MAVIVGAVLSGHFTLVKVADPVPPLGCLTWRVKERPISADGIVKVVAVEAVNSHSWTNPSSIAYGI